MAIITIDGFPAYQNLDGTRAIIVDSDRIDECMQTYTNHKLEGVAITTWRDYYKLQNIDFMSDYPGVKRVSISEGVADIKAIHALKNLEWLMLSGKGHKIDFLNFNYLKTLITDWSESFLNLDNCSLLRKLSVHHYNPKNKDCSSLSVVPWIKKLTLVQSNIISFKGLEKFDQLEELEIHYCSKLETLCCLENSKNTFIYLRCDHCKSIKNHEYATQLPYLKTLAYCSGGSIPSIKFISNIPSLKKFMFVGTDVIDGDISPCIGLEYAGFTNKKHFSHKMEEIKKGVLKNVLCFTQIKARYLAITQ